MKVTNMKSARGNDVPNQFIIHTPEHILFQSYESVIVKITHSNGVRIVFLDETYWNYSNTTSKYRNLFLGKTSREVKNNIDKGVYILTDLND